MLFLKAYTLRSPLLLSFLINFNMLIIKECHPQSR